MFWPVIRFLQDGHFSEDFEKGKIGNHEFLETKLWFKGGI